MKFQKIKQDLLSYAFLLFCALIAHSSLASSYVVPSGSMEPTIEIGDRFWANKLAFRLKLPFTKETLLQWSIPRAGDIVVFKYPADESQTWTKRIVGTPGDKVEIKDGTVFINDLEQPLSLITEDDKFQYYEENLAGLTHAVKFSRINISRNYGPVVVPKDKYFMMGDNRDLSKDSRYIGFVPFANLDGTLAFRWYAKQDNIFGQWYKRMGPI